MARCRSEAQALPARHASPDAATSASSKTTERSIKDSSPDPAAPEVSLSTVDTLSGLVMKVGCDFFELVSGARTWICCCAVFYIGVTNFCRSKQTHRCAPPCGYLVLAVLVVMFHFLSTVDAAKPRPFRDATANVWAEGKPSERIDHAMAAGPDGSLYVFGGDDGSLSNELYKLDLDTKEWHLITPRGSVRPSPRSGHTMVSVGNDLFVFGGYTGSGEDARWLATVWGHVRYCADDCSADQVVTRGSVRQLYAGMASCVAEDTP